MRCIKSKYLSSHFSFPFENLYNASSSRLVWMVTRENISLHWFGCVNIFRSFSNHDAIHNEFFLLIYVFELCSLQLVCNKITTTQIQISCKNWNGFFSNINHRMLIQLQCLTIAIIFELIYYINGYFRIWLTSMNIDSKCHAYLLY